jgi:AcrR family transcriptional regulator
MSDLPLAEYRQKSHQTAIAEQERANSQRVYAVLFELLQTSGVAQISLQQISKLSGISRTTLYRRWPSVDALILDAIADRVPAEIQLQPEMEARQAFSLMLHQLAYFLSSSLGRAFLKASLSIEDDISLQKRDALWQQRYQQITEIFQRLAPDHPNLDTVICMTLGSFYFQIFIRNEPADQPFIQSIVRSAQHLLQAKGDQ